MRLLNEKSIMDTWLPILKESTKIQDEYKLEWVAKYCHNHEMFENTNINETFTFGSAYSALGNINGIGAASFPSTLGGPNTFYTGATGSGDKYPTLLPIAIQVAARTIAFDLVPVIPMSTPLGVLTYMDYIYAGGKISSTQAPYIIKINASNINSTEYVNGTTYWGVSEATSGSFAGTAKAVQLMFVGYSRINKYPMFRVGQFYTGGTGSWTASTTTTLADIFDGSAVITKENTSVPDPTNNAATFIAVSASADYASAFENVISGPAGAGATDTGTWSGPFVDGTTAIQPMTRETGEVTYYRMMNLKLFNKVVQAETYQIGAIVTQEQIQDLQKQHNVDALQMVENALINEVSQNISRHILSRLFALGWSNNSETLAAEGITLNVSLNPADLTGGTATYINMKDQSESLAYNAWEDFGDYENKTTVQRRLQSRVLAAADMISHRGRRGPATFVVSNAQIAGALKDSANYSVAPVDNKINTGNGVYPIGSFNGMTVYVDPNMKYSDTRVLVGRKGSDDEPGIKFAPYIMAEKIETISEGTMGPKVVVKSRYALVEAGFYPETMYYTFHVALGGKLLV